MNEEIGCFISGCQRFSRFIILRPSTTFGKQLRAAQASFDLELRNHPSTALCSAQEA